MVIPVILEDTFENVATKVQSVENVAPLIQLDFVDGNLAPRKSFMDYGSLKTLQTKAQLEVHLMVNDPMAFLDHKFDTVVKVCTQVEAPVDIQAFLTQAKQFGYQVGLSLELDTPNTALEPYIEQLDFVQFMAVNLGHQGQPFDEKVLVKLSQFCQKHPGMFVQVDGGVNEENIPKLKNLGVQGFVVGSAIFGHGNPRKKYIELTSYDD